MLRANDNGAYTVPSRSTYPHQWNWDSALAALGWAEIDSGRAWTELETLARARDRRGMIPHIAFHTRVPDRLNGRLRSVLTTVARPYARYLPGPRWWGRRFAADGRRISGITQPPLAATCARLVFEQHPDERRARALLRPLLAWHRFLLEERDPNGVGEPVLVHPWESGRDNALEWDVPLWRVLPEVAVLHRRDTDSVDAAERPSDEHYRRFLTLVRHGTAIGWDQALLAREGGFRVLDPGFSAILARACLDLARLATDLGEGRIAEESQADGERVAASLRARASSDGLIRAVDLIDGSPLDATGAGSALAALTPGLAPAGSARAGRGGGRRPARLALRRAHPLPRRPRALPAQLLARPRVGERHLALRARARRARGACGGGHSSRPHARRDRGRRDARVLRPGLGPRARHAGLHLDRRPRVAERARPREGVRPPGRRLAAAVFRLAGRFPNGRRTSILPRGR